MNIRTDIATRTGVDRLVFVHGPTAKTRVRVSTRTGTPALRSLSL